MTTAILLIIFIILFMFWGPISRWFGLLLQRWLARRMMRMFGLRSDETEKKRKNPFSKRNGRNFRNTGKREQQKPGTRSDEPLIPKEYAEDVEYTEIKSYSSSTIIEGDDSEITYTAEEQVSDAEFEEINNSRTSTNR